MFLYLKVMIRVFFHKAVRLLDFPFRYFLFFQLKLAIGKFLFWIGYLSGIAIHYHPQRRVYFGMGMKKWRKLREMERKIMMTKG